MTALPLLFCDDCLCEIIDIIDWCGLFDAFDKIIGSKHWLFAEGTGIDDLVLVLMGEGKIGFSERV
jgi:hypothetical protein